jgi:hypothetical protein
MLSFDNSPKRQSHYGDAALQGILAKANKDVATENRWGAG